MTLDDRLEPIAVGWREWAYDQLDGTSYIKGELEAVEEHKKQATQAILSDLLEIIGEDDKTMVVPEPIQGIDQLWLAGRATGEFSAKNVLRQELREKVKEYCK